MRDMRAYEGRLKAVSFENSKHFIAIIIKLNLILNAVTEITGVLDICEQSFPEYLGVELLIERSTRSSSASSLPPSLSD